MTLAPIFGITLLIILVVVTTIAIVYVYEDLKSMEENKARMSNVALTSTVPVMNSPTMAQLWKLNGGRCELYYTNRGYNTLEQCVADTKLPLGTSSAYHCINSACVYGATNPYIPVGYTTQAHCLMYC